MEVSKQPLILVSVNRTFNCITMKVVMDLIKICILFLIKFQNLSTNGENLLEVVEYFNKELKIQTNLFVNVRQRNNSDYIRLLSTPGIPKVLIFQEKYVVMRDLYMIFNMRVLTVATVEAANFNATLNLLDGLLWRRHFTHIVFEWKCVIDLPSSHLLLSFFRECWKRGFTKVVVLGCQNNTFTYTPYPKIQVRQFESIWDYREISHWHNLQQFEILVPAFDFPPRCFSYHNRQGSLCRTGYYYKIVQTFVAHYNGSLCHEPVNIWANITLDFVDKVVLEMGFSFITTRIPKSLKYENSDSIGFASTRLIVPAGTEIHQSLYLIISFGGKMWRMVALILAAMCILFSLMKYRKSSARDLSGSLLQSLNAIIFIHIDDIERRTVLNFYLHLLFLFTGICLTNLYSGNLCSMYTLRIYEPDMKTIKDIAKSELHIIGHTADIKSYKALTNLPPIFFERLLFGNNTELQENRQKLNLIYIFVALDDLIDFLMFQQRFLKRQFARALPEPISQDYMAITLPPRSTLIDPFNRYLRYVRDSGILNKLLSDTHWDGAMSGVIQFFRNDETNRSLSLVFFEYAFITWSLGLLVASVCFIFEIVQTRRTNTAQ